MKDESKKDTLENKQEKDESQVTELSKQADAATEAHQNQGVVDPDIESEQEASPTEDTSDENKADENAQDQEEQTAGERLDSTIEKTKSFFANLSKKSMIAIAAVVVVVIALVFVINERNKTIDLSKYVRAEFSGYNGYGTCNPYFDYELFLAENAEKINQAASKKTKNQNQNQDQGLLSEISGHLSEQSEEYLAAEFLIAVGDTFGTGFEEVENNSKLSNGDKVKIQLIADENLAKARYNIKIKNPSQEVTVSDLEEIKNINIFDHIQVDYYNMAPYGYVEVSVNPEGLEENVSSITFEVENNEDLSNGDQVIIHAQNDPNVSGVALEKDSDSLTLNGFPEMLSKLEDVPESYITEFDKDARDYITALYAKNGHMFSTESVDLVGKILFANKNLDTYGVSNRLNLVYKIRAKIHDEEQEVFEDVDDHYILLSRIDLEKDKDGNITARNNDIEKTSDRFEVEKKLSSYYFWGYQDIADVKRFIDQQVADFTYETDIEELKS